MTNCAEQQNQIIHIRYVYNSVVRFLLDEYAEYTIMSTWTGRPVIVCLRQINRFMWMWLQGNLAQAV